METYAERLEREKEKKMTIYDMDELRRQGKVPDLEKRGEFDKDIIENEKNNLGYDSVKLGKDEAPYTSIDIELPDDDFRKIALQAHERDITFNKMTLLILKDGMKDLEYRFEHGNKPQLLNEDK